jgi:predicted SAM-dependent methyltransferase
MRFWQSVKVGQRELGSYTKIQTLYSRCVRDQSWQYAQVPSSKRYLNVGPGPNVDVRFVNVDWHWRPVIDVCLDIANGIGFPDRRFDGIFTEHCLEHVSFQQCVRVIEDFFRVLVPGGILRIIVPDGELYLDLYHSWKRGDRTSFPYVDPQGRRDYEEDSRYGFTPMMAVNRIFRGYEHRFAWDFETLQRVLSHAGFNEIRRVVFREGNDPMLLIDSEVRRPQSLYVESRRAT